MNRLFATLAVVMLGIVGSLFVASPAQAAWSQCQATWFCLWTGRDAGGDFAAYTLSMIRNDGGIDLPYTSDNASDSWFNRTGVSITIYDNPDCYESGWFRSMANGQKASSQNSDWGGRVSSIADPTQRQLPCD